MSKRRIKRAKEKNQEKKPNVLTRTKENLSVKVQSVSSKFSEWKKARKEQKLEKQELNELAYRYARDLKELSDRAALIELAKKSEARAKHLRELAEEM